MKTFLLAVMAASVAFLPSCAPDGRTTPPKAIVTPDIPVAPPALDTVSKMRPEVDEANRETIVLGERNKQLEKQAASLKDRNLKVIDQLNFAQQEIDKLRLEWGEEKLKPLQAYASALLTLNQEQDKEIIEMSAELVLSRETIENMRRINKSLSDKLTASEQAAGAKDAENRTLRYALTTKDKMYQDAIKTGWDIAKERDDAFKKRDAAVEDAAAKGGELKNFRRITFTIFTGVAIVALIGLIYLIARFILPLVMKFLKPTP